VIVVLTLALLAMVLVVSTGAALVVTMQNRRIVELERALTARTLDAGDVSRLALIQRTVQDRARARRPAQEAPIIVANSDIDLPPVDSGVA
jgi:cell division protein FtsL